MTLRVQDQRIVRYDPMLPSTGLFGSVGNGKRPKLDVKCAFGGVVWRMRGPDHLGIPEQTLLLVLLELAEEQYGQAQQKIDDWVPIETELYREPDAQPLTAFHQEHPPALATLCVSYAELAQRCGRTADGGSAAKQIRRELMRMSEVTVWAVMGNQEFSSRLLHWRRGDGHGAQVILNARLTEILIGRQYSPVSLQERLALKSDIARALHCALSVRIRPGKTMSFNLGTLAPYVWCEPEVADATVRRRRQQLRAAMCEFDELRGWSIRTRSGEPFEQADSVRICRKATTPGRLRSVHSQRTPIVEQLPSPVAKPSGKKSQTIADVSSLFA